LVKLRKANAKEESSSWLRRCSRLRLSSNCRKEAFAVSAWESAGTATEGENGLEGWGGWLPKGLPQRSRNVAAFSAGPLKGVPGPFPEEAAVIRRKMARVIEAPFPGEGADLQLPRFGLQQRAVDAVETEQLEVGHGPHAEMILESLDQGATTGMGLAATAAVQTASSAL
jgi:hypothetical protein